MWFPCLCEGCLPTLALWLEAERLWDADADPPAPVPENDITEIPYWPGSLVGPW
jgi:hypothetical protein